MPSPMASVRSFARSPALNVLLFVATIATTLQAGATVIVGPQSHLPPTTAIEFIVAGLPFAGSLIAILLCHEMGHYVAARAYGVDSTLPFFIPLPLVGFGTLGAVIRLRSAMPSRKAVLTIGAAGPIAGFVVAVPLLLWGFAHSEVRAMDPLLANAAQRTSVIDLLVSLWNSIHGEQTAQVHGGLMLFGDSLLTWAASKLAVGTVPAGHYVFTHPVADAAWIGLFITALNLIPAGQLDGGHVSYAFFGQRGALWASRVVSVGLLASGLFLSFNWFIWWLFTLKIGLRHPPALRDEPLGTGGRILALASLILFAITFVPVPFTV
jgi:membrane-associated protease RseP (regulator of RpoE activity)